LGDSEYLTLGPTQIWTVLAKETGSLFLKATIDKYGSPGSGTGTIEFRTHTTQASCEEASWFSINEGEQIISQGWVQLRVTNP